MQYLGRITMHVCSLYIKQKVVSYRSEVILGYGAAATRNKSLDPIYVIYIFFDSVRT